MCAKRKLRLDRERGWIATPRRQRDPVLIARIVIDSAIIVTMYIGRLMIAKTTGKRGY